MVPSENCRRTVPLRIPAESPALEAFTVRFTGIPGLTFPDTGLRESHGVPSSVLTVDTKVTGPKPRLFSVAIAGAGCGDGDDPEILALGQLRSIDRDACYAQDG